MEATIHMCDILTDQNSGGIFYLKNNSGVYKIKVRNKNLAISETPGDSGGHKNTTRCDKLD